MAHPYQAAIRITGENGVPAMLAVITSGLIGATTEVNRLQKGFAGLNKVVIGAALAMGGFEVLKGVKGFEEAGERLVHAKTMFEAALPAQQRMANMSLITATAWKEAGTNLRTEAAANVEAIHDLYTVLQNVPHAVELLPSFNILKNMLDSVKEKVGGAGEGKEIAAAIRAFDLAGRNTAETLKHAAESFAKTELALRGRVTGSQLLTQVQSAGSARLGWNDTFLTQGFPALMALGLGSRTGNAMYQMDRLWGGGGGSMSSKMQMMNQETWWLHKKEDEITEKNSKGKDIFKGFKAGSIFGADLLKADPIAWSTTYLDLLKSHGVDVADKVTMMKVVADIGKNNKLLLSAFSELLLPGTHAQLLREVANMGGVGPGAAMMVNERDPKAIHQQVEEQWKNAQEAFGEKLVVPMLDNVLKPIAGLLRDISQWTAHTDPTIVRAIGVSLAALGAGLVVLGGAAAITGLLGMLGPAGWLIGGVLALSAAAGVVYAAFNKNWQGAFNSFKTAMSSFWDWLTRPWGSAAGPGKGGSVRGADGQWHDIAGSMSDFSKPGGAHHAAVTAAAHSEAAAHYHAAAANHIKVAALYPTAAATQAIHQRGSGIAGNTAVWAKLPPEARGLLDALSGPESGGSYSKLFGGGHFKDFSHHPGHAGQGGATDSGRYQFTQTTWRGVQRALGLSDFSPENQDRGAWYLAQHDYKTHTGHDLLGDLRAGHFNPGGLASTWVSIRNLGHAAWMRRYFAPNMARALGAHPAAPHLKTQMSADEINAWNAAHGTAHTVTMPSADTQKKGESFMHWMTTPWHKLGTDSGPSPWEGIAAKAKEKGSQLWHWATTPWHKFGSDPHESAVPPRPANQNEKQSHVYLDGRKVGHLIERHIVRNHRFAHGTADHDGRAGVPAVDYASNMK